MSGMALRSSHTGVSNSPGHLRGIFALAGRHILRIAVLFVSVGRALRMVGGIFHAFDCGGFNRLICVGQFFYRLLIRVADFRESERTPTLTSAIYSDLCGIVAQIIEPGFEIALQFRGALVVGVNVV